MPWVVLGLLTAIVSGCGGGGGSTASPAPSAPPPAAAAPAPNYVRLQSDSGDYIGLGRTYDYSQTNSILRVSAVGGHLSVQVQGDQQWTGDFALASTATQLQAGTYTNLQRYPFSTPGLSWYGNGRGCNTSVGTMTIDSVSYANGVLTAIDLHFEQHCESNTAALRGQIHWTSSDTSAPPGPVTPPPANLWRPVPGVTPATGNYVYLQSDAGDYIGQGLTHTYTQANSTLTPQTFLGRFAIAVAGNDYWNGSFQAMGNLSQLQAGYYGNLQRYPFGNPAFGGMDWTGNGRGCNTLQGWFVIDSISYVNGMITAIDLRFEQHCEGNTAALHGQVHWAPGDTTAPPGPVNPPPAGLWQPAAGSTPASGNYVYLQSDPADYVGAGRTYTYTQANAVLTPSSMGGRFTMGVAGNENWSGNFLAMQSLSQLQTGYYGNLQRYPFGNAIAGSLDWSGNGRGCNILSGWFVVDNVTYVSGVLTAIDLRFEQHCEGAAAALHGQIHWAPGDTTAPPGPVNPPPASLWQPAVGSTPASGNYVYLESDPGDYIGAGQTYTYTQANARFSPNSSTGRLGFNVAGNQSWTGSFQAMLGIAQLQPGYYPNVQRYPFNNPLTGGMDWSGEGRGCNTLQGWFVVDSITYVNNVMTAVDLRFEQHCEGGLPALRGKIHYAPGDTTGPAGPLNPPPAGLWQAAPGVTPTSGNYVYLQSDVGDYIGQGQTYTYTPGNSTLNFNPRTGGLNVGINGSRFWSGDFQGMFNLAQLQPGYYGNLQRYPFHNAVFGGLSWSGDGRGCNTLQGWFVVDNVSYVAGVLTAIDLRFEQHCEGMTAALHGKIHLGP